MCWFFKKKKPKVDKQEEHFAKKNEEHKITGNPATVDLNRPLESSVERAYKEDANEKTKDVNYQDKEHFSWPKKNATNDGIKEKDSKPTVNGKATTQQKPLPKKTSPTKYAGKYEVYPEAGSYKFRLKASNGEILAVSFRYTNEKGALAGIETFKKNVETGVFEFYTDKSNYSQFTLYNASKARVIIKGEFYNNNKQAEAAADSVKNFYKTDKIEIISKILESEVREELVDFEKVEEKATGKYEIFQDGNDFYIRLKASNAQVLFTSTGYSSKASAKQGLETIKKAISENRFTVGRDKQKRYQFNLYSSSNQLILTGETYPVKTSCINAISSVRKFAVNAKIIEK